MTFAKVLAARTKFLRLKSLALPLASPLLFPLFFPPIFLLLFPPTFPCPLRSVFVVTELHRVCAQRMVGLLPSRGKTEDPGEGVRN
jgi:hypothetical protein